MDNEMNVDKTLDNTELQNLTLYKQLDEREIKIAIKHRNKQSLKKRYLIGHDNAIYTFSIEISSFFFLFFLYINFITPETTTNMVVSGMGISLLNKGQNKSKLQKQRSSILISILTAA